MPRDIADILDSHVANGQRPGCTIWLCMVVTDLARAAREIRKLRKELAAVKGQAGLFGRVA